MAPASTSRRAREDAEAAHATPIPSIAATAGMNPST